jgi:hypothetical protein
VIFLNIIEVRELTKELFEQFLDSFEITGFKKKLVEEQADNILENMSDEDIELSFLKILLMLKKKGYIEIKKEKL